MRTTPNPNDERPDRTHNRARARAWALLTENTPGSRRLPHCAPEPPSRLMDIARNYDRLCRHADGHLQPDAAELEILAGLLAIRTLREKLDHDELKLTTLARA
ncbi:hypothetical protein [Streptomyces gilvosporeus]|uniref:Uncharacterized protein n=1 Tax=Streptomyces gilvosporeus TaxID=553510 RepID=A0A1V0TIU2_9ACTN|nr:hypothetical protein [Streptomyces gilvosporeus]ARF52839.1 hypothetical protein B1H19_00235 [Streptomyces gilvosporeus]